MARLFSARGEPDRVVLATQIGLLQVVAKRSSKKVSSTTRSLREYQVRYWAREFDVLHARMQTQQARQAVDALFSATDAEINGEGQDALANAAYKFFAPSQSA